MKHLNLKLSIAFICSITYANAQVVSTLAGSGSYGSTNGIGTSAEFNWPFGVTADANGNLYVADMSNHEIRKIVIATRAVTTLAGSTTPGSADGTGAAAGFSNPYGLTTDGNGNLYLAEKGGNKIRKIVIATGVVTTLAGSGFSGSANGTGTAASFNYPEGIVYDGAGNLYVADYDNYSIRKIVIATGAVTTLAGSFTSPGSVDGTGNSASFDGPTGIAYDGAGNLYVADANNHKIRKIVIATGAVTTLAGSGSSGSANGVGTAASFNHPTGVAMGGSGILYVADKDNNEIRKIVIATKVVSTLAGDPSSGSADGTGTSAYFYGPTGVGTDASGNVYVADQRNNTIRKISIVSGISEFDFPANLNVYPNPFTSQTTISFDKEIKDVTIKIVDVLGKEVKNMNFSGKQLTFEKGELEAGIYFIKMVSENELLINKKIIIQ